MDNATLTGDPKAFRRLRLKAGLSIPEVAELAGKGRNTVWKFENGVASPLPSTLRALAAALGQPVSALTVAGLSAATEDAA